MPKDLQRSLRVLTVQEFEEMSETGAIGHPDLASAEKGERFLSGISESVIDFVKDFAAWE